MGAASSIESSLFSESHQPLKTQQIFSMNIPSSCSSPVLGTSIARFNRHCRTTARRRKMFEGSDFKRRSCDASSDGMTEEFPSSVPSLPSTASVPLTIYPLRRSSSTYTTSTEGDLLLSSSYPPNAPLNGRQHNEGGRSSPPKSLTSLQARPSGLGRPSHSCPSSPWEGHDASRSLSVITPRNSVPYTTHCPYVFSVNQNTVFQEFPMLSLLTSSRAGACSNGHPINEPMLQFTEGSSQKSPGDTHFVPFPSSTNFPSPLASPDPCVTPSLLSPHGSGNSPKNDKLALRFWRKPDKQPSPKRHHHHSKQHSSPCEGQPVVTTQDSSTQTSPTFQPKELSPTYPNCCTSPSSSSCYQSPVNTNINTGVSPSHSRFLTNKINAFLKQNLGIHNDLTNSSSLQSLLDS